MALLQLPKLHLLKQEARGEAPGGAAMWKAYDGASGMTKIDWRPEVMLPVELRCGKYTTALVKTMSIAR